MSSPARILIVEDDSHVARRIANMLPRCEVRIADSVAATRQALDFDPDVIVLDFHLPDGTARDLANDLTCPVLLTSGDLDANAWDEWGAYFADDFLRKPFRAAALRQRVHRLVEMRRLELEVAHSHAELRRANAELVSHLETRDIEAVAARDLLDRMVGRSRFDPQRVRVELLMARRFGGDVVLADDVPDGRYRWLVGDVTGHTLASALVTIPISMIFHTTCRKAIPLAEVVGVLHDQLRTILPPSMFFAAVICELDRQHGRLTVCNAGSPDVVVRRVNGTFERIAANLPPLAALRGPISVELVATPVEPGDAIYAFSDGLVEVCDGTTMFGMERSVSTILDAPDGAAFEHLRSAWRAHLGEGKRDDDLALIEVRV